MTKHKIRFGIGGREVILILEASAAERPSVYFYHHDSLGSLLSGFDKLLVAKGLCELFDIDLS